MERITTNLKQGSDFDIILLIIAFVTLCYALFVNIEGDPLSMFDKEQSIFIYFLSAFFILVYFILNKRRDKIAVTLIENKADVLLVQRLGYVPFSGYVKKNIVSIEKSKIKELHIYRFASVIAQGGNFRTNAVRILFLVSGMRGFVFDLKDRELVNKVEAFVILNAPSVKVTRTLA